MSKSGNYNLGEIEKRDRLIQELSSDMREALALLKKGTTGWGVAKDILAQAIIKTKKD